MLSKQSISVLIIIALVSCAPSSTEPAGDRPETIHDVSLVQLIATPEQFQGERVRVKGFGHLEFEAMGLLLDREDSEYLISKNGIWLDLNVEQFQEFSELSDHFLLAEGRFTPENKGHGDAWSGALEEVTRLEPLRKIEELRRLGGLE